MDRKLKNGVEKGCGKRKDQSPTGRWRASEKLVAVAVSVAGDWRIAGRRQSCCPASGVTGREKVFKSRGSYRWSQPARGGRLEMRRGGVIGGHALEL